MEIKLDIEVKYLNKEDITIILNEAFKCPWWNENKVEDFIDKFLKFEKVSIYNSENGKEYMLDLDELYDGIELFIKKGGRINPKEYDLFDGDYILQYSLFGKLSYHITITKTFLKDK